VNFSLFKGATAKDAGDQAFDRATGGAPRRGRTPSLRSFSGY
jgi:hypothetical protein